MSIGSSNPGIVAKVAAGTNVTVTGTPTNPIINSTGGGGSGTVTSVSATAPATVSNPTTTPNIVVPIMVASGASHAAGLVPDPGVTGGATKFLREDATFAVPAGGGGGGALTQIAQVIVTSAQPTISFSSIPNTFSCLQLVCMGRSANASSEDDLVIQMNGDTGANYARTIILGNGLSVISNSSNSSPTSNLGIAAFAAATAAAGLASLTIIYVPYYALTTFNKYAVTQGGWRQGSGVADLNFVPILGEWRSTAAISSLLLATASGSNFVVGSAFTLYGLQ